LALFCNVPTEAVITARDVECIYEVPLALAQEGLDEIILRCLSLPAGERHMEQWEQLISHMRHPADTVSIGIVGKYVDYEDSYKSLKEALVHGGLASNVSVEMQWVEAEGVEGEGWQKQLEVYDGILVPGGFGKRGIAGMLRAIEYARTRKVPYFGICLGMQTAVIEFARNACGLEGADSSEFDPATPHRIIYKLRELRGVDELGGTMRLGAWQCQLAPGSNAHKAYGTLEISERHRHRYEFNREYEETIVAHGMKITGSTPDGTYVEIVEIPDHPWFLGCQFHPEFKSKPLVPHPLFKAFIAASYAHRQHRLGKAASGVSVAGTAPSPATPVAGD
jgi:CTP synthase